jgi:hypothetical protein
MDGYKGLYFICQIYTPVCRFLLNPSLTALGGGGGEALHCKKSLSNFPSPTGMSLIKLSLGGNNLIIPSRESLVSDIPDGDGKIDNLFYIVPFIYTVYILH